MNEHLLNIEAQQFINKNLNVDISKLVFKGSPFDDITIQELVEQIESKKKAQYKLPTWFNSEYIYYPNKLNIAQTSSEITANYKAKLIRGNTIIDLTGGYGIDALAFADRFNKVIHCEINKDLSAISKYNFEILNIDNIQTISKDGIAYLKEEQVHYDWIYIDPSRRNDIKGKVFLLKDCEPNVPENLEVLFEFGDNIMVKVSPMLDITSVISELKFVKEIHVVAVQNEVKELLLLLDKGYHNEIQIKTINIKKETSETFDTIWLQNSTPAPLSIPLTYLYEPNVAILKAGLFNEVSHQLDIAKLNVNSHLYTLNDLIEFPGRRFNIIKIIPYKIKELKKFIDTNQANITTRNFPETVAQIRKKTNLKEGGTHYLFFTKDKKDNLIVLITHKV